MIQFWPPIKPSKRSVLSNRDADPSGWGRCVMCRWLAILVLAVLGGAMGAGFKPGKAQNAALMASPDRGEVPVFVDDYPDWEFCADQLSSVGCANPPVDVPEFDASFVYRFLAYNAQRPFDRFSWQAMLAVMADDPSSGNDRNQTRSPIAVWQRFVSRDRLMDGVSIPSAGCADDLPINTVLLTGYRQSTGDVLIDQAGNFIVYDTRINPVAAAYIRDHHLDQAYGRAAFAAAGMDIDFPRGRLIAEDRHSDDPITHAPSSDGVLTPVGAATGEIGAQFLKFAWRVMPDDVGERGLVGANLPDPSGYYTRPARIALGGDDTLDGHPLCLDVTVGLVGLHLVQRVQSGNGDRWIWSSFEHVDNLPLAGNARRPNSIIGDALFPDGCRAPQSVAQPYLFFDGIEEAGGNARPLVNRWDGRAVKWADHAPYARFVGGQPAVPAKLVRCWRIFSGTAETNFIWQNRLSGSVWENYMLLGTQWIGNPGGAPFGIGEIPRYLSNSALESFMQDQTNATCLGCHVTATTDAEKSANFTFLLSPNK
ncbi:hypothetical protein LPB41_04695 [Thalassospira sp. MA62]|nr:hypothetical protein [Thalassospira sp. MA62]